MLKANKRRTEIDVDLAGTSLVLSAAFQRLEKAEDILGRGLLSLPLEVRQGRMPMAREVVALYQVFIKKPKSMEAGAIRSLISRAGMTSALVPILDLCALVQQGEYVEDQEPAEPDEDEDEDEDAEGKSPGEALPSA